MLRLQLIGSPAIGPGDALQALARKDAALLCVLALDGPTARDALAALLWPDVPLKTANINLRQRVFRLRKQLGHEVVHAGDAVALDGGVEVDVLAARAAAAAGGTGRPVAHGDLLGGLDYADCPALADWLRQERSHWHRHRQDALAAAAEQHERAGELVQAIELAHELVAEQPLSDHAQRRLMRLHYLRGDRVAAVAAFERFEAALKDDSGGRPDAETIALLHTIEQAVVPAGARAAPMPASLKRPPRLVGRDRELRALAQAWEAGRVFLVLGEAGMGKTRLLQEFAAGRPGVLHVSARLGDASVPFALLARLLRGVQVAAPVPPDEGMRRELARVLPELGGPGAAGGEGQRLVLQRAVEGLLQAACGRGLAALLLDDLHFADDASLEILQSLAGSEANPALPLGLAQRGGEGSAAAEALRLALEESQRLHEVALAPLDTDAMRALVESLGLPELDAATLAPSLVRHTGGNPLFALETLKDMLLTAGPGGLAEAVGAARAVPVGTAPGLARLPQPATVGALIERRLKRLSPAGVALARVASLAGVDFSIELAESVLATPALALADAWSELQAAQVLNGTAFAHDLVQDAVRRSVPEHIAAHVRGGIAARLLQTGADPARVAEHWRAAGRWAEAAAQYGAAAARAAGAGRHADATRLYRDGADCLGRAGDRAGRWAAELASLDSVSFSEGSAQARALAERLLAEAANPPETARAHSAVAQAAMLSGDWGATLDQGQQGLTHAGPAGLPGVALDCELYIAMALAQAGRPIESLQRLEALPREQVEQGSPAQRSRYLSSLAYVLNLADRPADSARVLADFCELSRAQGDLAEVANGNANLAVTLSAVGRSAQALQRARAARGLFEQLGAASGLHPSVNMMNLGAVATQVGDYREALAALQEATATLAPSSGPLWVDSCSHHLATLWLVLAQHHRAAALLGQALGTQHPATQVRRAVLQARLARLLGQPRPAAPLEALLQELDAGSRPRALFGLRLELSYTQTPLGALQALRQVQQQASEIGHQGVALHARMREADILAAIDPGHAAEVADWVAQVAHEVEPADVYLPELWLVCARAWQAAGREPDALQRIRSAWQWVQRHAEEQLESAMREPFLKRNPVNAELRRRLGNPQPPLG
jgi:DNA-binding SARP family transcriptional activator